MDQAPAQSEPRLRLAVAQHVLRDLRALLARMEVGTAPPLGGQSGHEETLNGLKETLNGH